MSKKILITGATGLIGRKITNMLLNRGDSVTVISRSSRKAFKYFSNRVEIIKWTHIDLPSKVEGLDSVVHLAGESVLSKRWNDEFKKTIYDSRIETTQTLVNAIERATVKPKAFICASAIGFYDNSDFTSEFTESSPSGNGFMPNLVHDWEKNAAMVEKSGVRRVSVRIGVILDKNEGALAKMMTPFKFFLGGKIGSGKQWIPWIHIDDLVDLFIYAIDNENVSGAVNGVSPGIVTMSEFVRTLGKEMSRPAAFPVPKFAIRLVLGEASEVVLKGARIKPQKTLGLGFEFNHTKIKSALKDLLD